MSPMLMDGSSAARPERSSLTSTPGRCRCAPLCRTARTRAAPGTRRAPWRTSGCSAAPNPNTQTSSVCTLSVPTHTPRRRLELAWVVVELDHTEGTPPPVAVAMLSFYDVVVYRRGRRPGGWYNRIVR